jgi:predicted DNA-binding transcriptional regulator AlpA
MIRGRRLLGIARISLYRHLAAGTIRPVKLGSRTLFRREELIQVLDEAPAWAPEDNR